MYRPKRPFSQSIQLRIPTTSKVNGKIIFNYDVPGIEIFGAFTTFGGTDTTVNNVLTVIDTGTLETWYRPDITSECRFVFADGSTYEILGKPENIEMRNQFLKIRLQGLGR